MTTTMMQKIEEAKKMVAHFIKTDRKGYYSYKGMFTPTTYQSMRWAWKGEATPAWATLVKYCEEAGLVAEEVPMEWHSDGSALAEMCGITDGTIFSHTFYRFE